MAGYYNGYAWGERMAKFREMQRRIAAGELDPPVGPCRLCGDPGEAPGKMTFEYHDEDYSLAYLWTEPAAYVLCKNCHVHRLHMRFTFPKGWAAFLAHVRRGGFARELREPGTKAAAYREALSRGEPAPVLRPLRPYGQIEGMEWFAKLQTGVDQADPRLRPRP